ncbi:YjgF-like protein [Exidia glandulosa HHB12029]|uniref:YjgF-like protein n=1 Tax=Exidia glandulosa HHB12029 TaxID=1314781 RepID=A0A165LRP2_EXIGL|nr:YjgF-like protein [Exidia glandulosa HHB12029]
MPLITTVHRTANPYENDFGYSRAVRRGPFISVSGTTSISPTSGELQHPGSAYLQARAIFSEIFSAITALGGTKTDVTRVRMFVTAQSDSGDVARAMKESMDGHTAFAATMICGASFVDPEMKVEIEADAVVG